jgi:hypothetical protein
MNPSPTSKSLPIIGAGIGALAGAVGMWITLTDRIEKSISERVTREILTETRIARLEERISALQNERAAERVRRVDNVSPITVTPPSP